MPRPAMQVIHPGSEQMTVAGRLLHAAALGARTTTRRRAKRAGASPRKTTRKRKSSSKPRKAAHLVKGSAAAKSYMAKLRKKANKARRA